MDRAKRNRKKTVNLEELSDDEMLELIGSVESELDEDSDDSVADPDYVFDNIEPDSVSFDDEEVIEEANDAQIYEVNGNNSTDAFIQAINASLHVSELGQPTASSTFIHDVAAIETVETEVLVSTSTATINATPFKPKRDRSPLPTIEFTGPSIRPNNGGFDGGGMNVFSVFL